MHPVPEALIPWFRANRRALPWREEPRDPYHVWVSEAMLQQTQVATVIPYYARFLQRFPTVAALAEAPEADVLKAWEGLGYYSRARNLHRAAQAIVERHGGKLPADYDALLALPGFGPYTAGAVASLAFGIPVPAVDGNVLRVASRVDALEVDVASPKGRREVEARVAAWLPEANAGELNEGLMELGATVCTPRAPACPRCPLAHLCRAHAARAEERYPVKARRAAPEWEERLLVVARAGDRVWMVRPTEGLLAGLWAFPTVPVAVDTPLADGLRAALEPHGLAWDAARPRELLRFSKVFTHRRWRVRAVEVRVAEGTGGEKEGEREWVPLAALGERALGDPSRRVAEWLRRNPALS